MLSNLSDSFINNLGKDFEVLYEQIKDIIPNLNGWQLNNGYLFDEKDYIKKIYAFRCNEDYITLGVYFNKNNSKIELYLNSNLDKGKLESILSKYDILNIRMCEGQKDISLLLESIYFGNFYYEYTDRVVDNKDTYMIKKKID